MSDFAGFSVDPDVVLRRGQIEADRDAFGASPEVPPAVDPEAFKAVMRVLASGVVMVTARSQGELYGLTVSACCSISASPPQILISLAETASCLPAILETRRFGVSILQAGQKPLAELGAVPGGPKKVEAFSESADRRVAAIAGALAHLECTIDQLFRASDHVLIVGNVEHAISPSAEELDDVDPLLYFNRTFHSLGPPLGREG
jgi:flavin reductase (DIM6/NTAB) family NADH-FMN oxidoreductase RutF